MEGAKSKLKWILLSIVTAIGGISFVGYGCTFLIEYIKDTPDNPHRQEYLEGFALSLILSSPFWLLLAAFAAPLKTLVSKNLFVLLRVPAIIVGTAFMLMNAFIFVMILLDTFQGK